VQQLIIHTGFSQKENYVIIYQTLSKLKLEWSSGETKWRCSVKTRIESLNEYHKNNKGQFTTQKFVPEKYRAQFKKNIIYLTNK